MTIKIPIEVSNKHIHLSQEDLDKLFDRDHELTKIKDLSQPGEFAAKEKVELVNGDNRLSLRVLGPVRDKTKIELSFTDVAKLKLAIKDSSYIIGAPDAKLIGPKGTITIKQKITVVKRHLHCTLEDAKKLNIEDKVDIFIPGERSVIFKDVIVRASPKSKLAFHTDRDEGNAAGIFTVGEGELLTRK